ncbi:MAG: TRAM domain-containing protein [Nanoarchaeota archaeon]
MYGEQRGFYRRPVTVGEELDVTIEALGEKGDGVAKKEGFVIFIPGVEEGQRVRIKINKVLRRVAFADVVGEAQAEEEAAEDSTEFGTDEEESPEEESADEESLDEEESGEEYSEDMPEDDEEEKE